MHIHIVPGIHSGIALLTESVSIVDDPPAESWPGDDELRAAFLRAFGRTDVDAPADKLASLAFGSSYLSLIMLGQLASATGRSPDEQLRELALELAEQIDEAP